MSLKMGIIGLPNVGKSTFFNAITNSKVIADNYPFATINPNIGVVEVKDNRLKELAKHFKPEKIIYTTFEFVDIAGIIKNASMGEGLGNKFLANIAETDAICQIVRCFENKDIVHVDGFVDSIRDVEVVNLELIIYDQNLVKKHLFNYHRKLKGNTLKVDNEKFILLNKISKYLQENKLLNQCNLNNDEIKLLKEFNFLTLKPFIYVANISESDLLNNKSNNNLQKLKIYANKQNIKVIELCVEFELQISQMDEEIKFMFMKEYKIKNSGLDKLILESYLLLNLKTFFTAGSKEVRGWTFHDGWLAPQCAGIIHTDFEKKFIKLEVYSYEDFLKYRSEKILKEKGKIRIEGKSYQMKDGDICYFRANK